VVDDYYQTDTNAIPGYADFNMPFPEYGPANKTIFVPIVVEFIPPCSDLPVNWSNVSAL
jgi:hypothetical protein